MVTLKQTPSQTVGPFFAYGLTALQYGYNHSAVAGGNLRGEGVDGEAITLTGRVLDGEGNPVDDALVEIWQADGEGHYPGPKTNSAFSGFGRVGTGTDPLMRFRFETIMPGPVEGKGAPHLDFIIFMRGALNHNFTRAYFDGHPANENDPVLQAVPEERRHTLMARELTSGIWTFDIHMQGENETVFFDV